MRGKHNLGVRRKHVGKKLVTRRQQRYLKSDGGAYHLDLNLGGGTKGGGDK